MQVEAAIDESDVGRLAVGQKATFTVDAFPGQTFQGAVQQVRKAALNVANVVTYVAVIRFSNADGRLMPGMTANVRIVTEERKQVLKVPNAALRLRIAGVEPPKGDGASRSSSRGRLYVKDAKGQPQAIAVQVGVTDGTQTELIVASASNQGADASPAGEGVEVLVAVKSAGGPAAGAKPNGPRSPF
jgi:HlyD family secretion protein